MPLLEGAARRSDVDFGYSRANFTQLELYEHHLRGHVVAREGDVWHGEVAVKGRRQIAHYALFSLLPFG